MQKESEAGLELQATRKADENEEFVVLQGVMVQMSTQWLIKIPHKQIRTRRTNSEHGQKDNNPGPTVELQYQCLLLDIIADHVSAIELYQSLKDSWSSKMFWTSVSTVWRSAVIKNSWDAGFQNV